MTKGFKKLFAVLLTLVICLAGVAGLSAQAEETVTKLVPKQVETPVAGTAYKLYLTQAKLGKTLYFTGEMAGYYFAVSEDATKAVDVYLEAVEGGYQLSFTKDEVKQYVDIYVYNTEKNSVGVRITAEPTAVYTYDTEIGSLVANIAGTDYYLGTYDTYARISASKTSYITETNLGVDQFPVAFCTLIEEEVTEETPEEPEEPTYVTTLESGDYVIWAPGYNKALSINKSKEGSYYNGGVDVVWADEKLTGCTSNEVWTVTKNEDGTYTISCEEGVFSMSTSYSSTDYNKENGTWVLEDAGDGSYYVKNVNRERYLQWSTQYGNWDTKGSIGTGNEGDYAVKFTPVENVTVKPVEPEVPEEPTNVTTLESGTYVIWAPGYNKALSSNYTGYNNIGVDVALADDVLSGYENSEIWTVTKNENGTYTISFDGKVLGMEDGYFSMGLDKVYKEWELYDAGNGLYYVMNVDRDAYMEWYVDKNYWSAYGNIADGKEGMFAIQFTPAVAQSEPELPGSPDSGDHSQMILWGAAMVCSAVAVAAVVLKKRNKKA